MSRGTCPRDSQKKKPVLIIILLCAVLAGCILYFFPNRLPSPIRPASETLRHWVQSIRERWDPQPSAGPQLPMYRVIRAIDGDTLLVSVDGREVSVRMIGIDAPESVHRETERNTPEGQEAARWMKEYISGKSVSLEYDQELTDQYGRTLAYVYADDVLLEDLLLTKGLARTLTMEPNTRYQLHFEQLEKEARESGAGFWGTGFFKE